MTEVPEHLLRRSAERRAALGAPPVGGGAAPPAGGAEATADDGSKIPAHLLARSQAAGGDGGGGPATPATTGAAAAPAAAATAVATAPAPVAKGPEGHTQRLLTVVKAGSIQDVKATPTDKVHTWPHLLIGEFIACLACSAFLLVFSALVNAPFLAAANFNFTPNPSKAPWYFLGLQELLTMFHPMVAGVTIPGIGIFGLMLAPYIDKNPSSKPEDRKFAIALFTLFLMFWAVLVIIGTLFRGPGFNFTFPWRDGVFFDL
ncbi:MAG TPA: menaquinol-cytochrome c reductase cytochrome b subunit [Acidimicrobiales bacterium]|jgi:menaquinol-cytochrome c reductase cytochrome b/c subunit|nr:menaquinol-cytochrome c reductase cytochrome b subunit [Acidimicrobiales bacterium]